MDLIQKIHRYIDTRQILSKPEKEAVKKFMEKQIKQGIVGNDYELAKTAVQGYASALIMQRLFALEN